MSYVTNGIITCGLRFKSDSKDQFSIINRLRTLLTYLNKRSLTCILLGIAEPNDCLPHFSIIKLGAKSRSKMMSVGATNSPF